MSLSQKHAGLILVPWFNSDEWRYVYHAVYSKDTDKQLKALELLQIWKLRTPILSSGVEGTLILLEALLLDTDSMSEGQISNLYAIALMRFLNLSAANNEKQGSFTRTSTKNELPKWLINLRHDIAHGHQIPSLYNLKMGLDYGFEWLKERYWEPQSKIIKDYYIGEDINTDTPLSQSLKAYAEINIALFENQDFDGEYIERVKRTIYKRFRRTVDHPFLMLDILLEMITQSLEKDQQREKICLDGLVSSNALLKPCYDILNESDEEENMIKGLDDDEIEFLDLVDRTKLAADRKKEIEEERELKDYRNRVAILQEKSIEERLQAEIVVNKPKVTSGSKPNQQKLLKGLVVKKTDSVKRKMSSSHCANGNESGDKPNGEERSPKQQKTIDSVADQGDSNVESSSDSAEEARAANVSAMKCVAVLPGLGYYADSSSDENSSDSDRSEIECKARTDLLGRKLQVVHKVAEQQQHTQKRLVLLVLFLYFNRKIIKQ